MTFEPDNFLALNSYDETQNYPYFNLRKIGDYYYIDLNVLKNIKVIRAVDIFASSQMYKMFK